MESGAENGRGQGKDTDPYYLHNDAEKLSNGGDWSDITISNGGEGCDRPVKGFGNVGELLWLDSILNHVHNS